MIILSTVLNTNIEPYTKKILLDTHDSTKYLYRYGTDMFSDSFDPVPTIEKHEVLRSTPKGWWIKRVYEYSDWRRYGNDSSKAPKERFVLKTTGYKRYAYGTQLEALEGYIKRRERYLCILNNKVDSVKRTISIAKSIQQQLLTRGGTTPE